MPKAEALREAKRWLRSLTAEQVCGLCTTYELSPPSMLACSDSAPTEPGPSSITRGQPGPMGPAQPPERPFEVDGLDGGGQMATRLVEALPGNGFIHDIEELALFHPPPRYIPTSTSAPSAYPSDPAGTTTNPSARVTDDSTDAPPIASGS